MFASWKLPRPTPSTVRKTPLSRFAAMKSSSSLGDEMPMLKSPSVTRITRLFAFRSKFFFASS